MVRDGHTEDVSQNLEDSGEREVDEDVAAQDGHAHPDPVVYQRHHRPVEAHDQSSRQQDPLRHHGEHGQIVRQCSLQQLRVFFINTADPQGITKGGLPGFPTQLCLLYTSPSPRDRQKSRMPSSA